MRRAVCPGSFDPLTLGHVDVITRAAMLFDDVVVAVLVNQSKQELFSAEERVEMLAEALEHLSNVTVASFSGLLLNFCHEREAVVVVKGVRAVSDFDTELQMAQMNRALSGVETVFVPTSPERSYLASSLVKEVARFGGDVSRLVPSNVLSRLRGRLTSRADTPTD